MVIVMETDSGKRIADESFCAYNEEVLNAGWAEVPRIEPRLEEAAVANHGPAEPDIEGFLARLYASQE